MLATRTVTFLADDSQHHAGLAVSIHRGSLPLEVAGMTFEAAWNDCLIEMRRAVGIARAVDPTVCFRPINNRELEKLVPSPEQVALPLARGTGNNVDAFGTGNRFGRADLF